MTTFTATSPIVKASDGRYGLRAPKGGCVVDGKVYRGGSFCRPYRVDNPRELATVEIKGADYLVEAIPAGECGVAAVRLTKLASGEAYDVLRTHDGLVECSCPDYEFRHRGTARTCKHGRAALAGCSCPDRGTARTCKHGRAALVHGLLIPPAPDSWPDSADADIWELGEAGPDSDPDAGRWELGPDDDGPRPTAGPDFEPDAFDLAEWQGQALRLEGEPMAEMETDSTGLLLRFAIGQSVGLDIRQERERADRDEVMGRDARFEQWVRHMEETEGVGEGPEYA